MLTDYFSIALKQLRRRKKRTWLTTIGIIIGALAVVALISLGQGMQNAINQQFAAIGADKIIISPKTAIFAPPTEGVSKITEKEFEAIKRTIGISQAAPRIMQNVIITFAGKSKPIMISQMPGDESAEIIKESLDMKISEGRMLRKQDKGKALIGGDYAYKNIFPKKIKIGDKLGIQNETYEVVGILKRRGNPGTDSVVFVTDNDLDAKEYNAVMAKATENPSQVAERVAHTLRRMRGQKKGQENFQVQTTEQIIQSFNTIFSVVQAVVIGIALISLIVGAIGIMNTMYTAVLERTREIGIMKAIGAKNEDIMKLFLIESGLVGMTGGIIGTLLGITLGKMVEYGAYQQFGESILQAHFPITLILGAIIFSFLIGALSGILPARKASKLNPVDAIRYD